MSFSVRSCLFGQGDVGKSAHRLIRTPFQSHEINSGMGHNLVPVVLLLKCVWELDGNTHVGLV